MKKLRLLLFEECNRKCTGCCNEDWDLKSVPATDSFENYDLIMLTGGEPMLRPELILAVVERIRMNNDCPIYLYTAKVDDMEACVKVIPWIDGITVTLHEQKDVLPFLKFANRFHGRLKHMKLRLNIFAGVFLTGPFSGGWDIKDDIEWIKDAPLPTNEVFRRIV